MQLTAGTRLGPYEIAEAIAAGAMGEVYRARDTRLPREVAIKILPAGYAQDERRRRRFEKEARTVSALNHPNICTLHDIGVENGLSYLVMEYCEGTTLEHRLKSGPLPIGEILTFGSQIADALSRAHRAGIVHRDLKPSNIIVTPSGVKILDFGVAQHARDGRPDDSTTAPVDDGVVGSLPYMAPEVLSGEDATPRSDIFALGVILYEMVTGKRPFGGITRPAAIASALDDQPPPPRQLRRGVPPALEQVITRSLAKQPDSRWESAHDVGQQLLWIAGTVSHPRTRTPWILATAAALVVVAIVASMALRKGPSQASGNRLSIALAEVAGGGDTPAIFPAHLMSNVAISPDGKRIAYAAVRDGRLRIYLRELDRFESVELSGTEGGAGPFFSPDGAWIGYCSMEAIFKIPAGGGAPVPIVRGLPQNARGAVWGRDGMIYFSAGSNVGIDRVSANGGAVQKVTEPDAARGETSHRWPALLPDGTHLLYTIRDDRMSSFDQARIAIRDLSTGQARVILEGGSRARHVPPGHIVYGRAGGLYAVPFSLRSLAVTGTPRQMVSGVVTVPRGGMADFDVNERGDLVYVPGTVLVESTDVLSITRAGKMTKLATLPLAAIRPELSPDGRTLALNAVQANDDIFLYDLQTGVLNRFSFEPGDETNAVFTPDGRNVIFNSFRPPRLMSRPADASRAAVEIVRASAPSPLSCSPDGRQLLYSDRSSETGMDLWILPLDGSGRPRPYLRTSFNEGGGQFSPDGKWIAYASDESGTWEVYVRAADGRGGRWQISSGGGGQPRWSVDGTEIFYRQGSEVLAVAVLAGPMAITFERPQALFTLPATNQYVVQVVVKGEGFLTVRNASWSQAWPEHINVVPGWARELHE